MDKIILVQTPIYRGKKGKKGKEEMQTFAGTLDEHLDSNPAVRVLSPTNSNMSKLENEITSEICKRKMDNTGEEIRKTILIPYSAADRPATEATYLHPEKVDKLIYLEGSPISALSSLTDQLAILSSRLLRSLGTEEDFERLSQRVSNNQKLMGHLLDGMVENSSEDYNDSLRIIQQSEPVKTIRDIHEYERRISGSPTLISKIRQLDSSPELNLNAVTSTSGPSFFARMLGIPRKHVTGSGHIPWKEQPEKTAIAIKDMINYEYHCSDFSEYI